MELRVSEWMTVDPATVRESDAALEAFDTMVDRGVRHLPVVNEAHRVIGILSIDDLRAAFPIDVSLLHQLGPVERRRLLDLAVADAMTWVPQTTRESATLPEAAEVLAQHRIGCLPVVDGKQRLIGILSETDVMRGFVAAAKGESGPAPDVGAQKGLVAELWEERARLAEELARWQESQRAISADIREEPRDAGDRATDERDVSGLGWLSDRASRRLRAIEVAIERAEHGRFGVCAGCEGAIPASRLRAIPETTLCVACAREAAKKDSSRAS